MLVVVADLLGMRDPPRPAKRSIFFESAADGLLVVDAHDNAAPFRSWQGRTPVASPDLVWPAQRRRRRHPVLIGDHPCMARAARAAARRCALFFALEQLPSRVISNV